MKIKMDPTSLTKLIKRDSRVKYVLENFLKFKDSREGGNHWKVKAKHSRGEPGWHSS